MPNTNIPDNDLDTAGFTSSGKTKFKDTVQIYCNELFDKAISYGEAEKGVGLPREVTHDHVKSGSYQMANSFGKDKNSKWLIATQIGEYLFTGIAGVGGGNLKETWGIVTFGMGLSLAVILIVVRLTTNSK